MTEIRTRGARLLFCALFFTGALPVAAETTAVVGDANGDGVFDQGDVAYVETLFESRIPITSQAGRLSDVAAPCDGRLDGQDLFRLRRAAKHAAQRSSRSAPLDSTCHGVEIGQAPPDYQAGAFDIPSLDDHFLAIADELPVFAGFYLDDGEPIVALTEPSAENLDIARRLILEIFDEERWNRGAAFQAVAAEHPFAELHAVRLLARPLLSMPEITGVDVDERRNRIWVGVRDESELELVEHRLALAGVAPELVRMELAQVAVHDKYDETARPLRSGRQTSRFIPPQSVSRCTMGPVVDLLGVRGWLTNTHCSALVGVADGSMLGQANSTPTAGVETVDPFFGPGVDFDECEGHPCRWSDSAFLSSSGLATSYAGMVETHPGMLAPFGYSFFHASVANPLDGEKICKSGRTTGYTCGEVTGTCSDHHVSDDDLSSDYFLFCQNKASYQSDGGDSGSPVYQTNGIMTATLFGLNWGVLEFGPLIDLDALFSPVSGLHKDLGPFDPFEQVAPPQVTITAPLDGTFLGTGTAFIVDLKATYWDDENGDECPQCGVSWSSDVDGALGYVQASAGEANLTASLWGAGDRVITATAHDNGSIVGTDQITLKVGQVDPQVFIDWPGAGQALWRDHGYVFEGSSFDPETFSPLPCSALQWFEDSTHLGSGCNPSLSFSTNGGRLIRLEGTDAQWQQGFDYVWVVVDDPPVGGGPQAKILQPAPGSGLAPDQFATFQVQGDDPDDASPLTYEWILKGPGLQPIPLFTTTANDEEVKSISFVPEAYVYVPCGGRYIELELRVTDPDGKSGTKTIDATVMHGPC